MCAGWRRWVLGGALHHHIFSPFFFNYLLYSYVIYLFPLSLCALTGGAGYASGGEDRSVRLWGGAGECRQTLHQPAQSVWSVAALPNGDVAAAMR